MPWIAHRRRGSKFGRHPVKFSLVPFRLLPLALRTSSLWPLLAPILPLRLRPGTVAHTFVSRNRLLSSFPQPAAATMRRTGSLCL